MSPANAASDPLDEGARLTVPQRSHLSMSQPLSQLQTNPAYDAEECAAFDEHRNKQ